MEVKDFHWGNLISDCLFIWKTWKTRWWDPFFLGSCKYVVRTINQILGLIPRDANKDFPMGEGFFPISSIYVLLGYSNFFIWRFRLWNWSNKIMHFLKQDSHFKSKGTFFLSFHLLTCINIVSRLQIFRQASICGTQFILLYCQGRRQKCTNTFIVVYTVQSWLNITLHI